MQQPCGVLGVQRRIGHEVGDEAAAAVDLVGEDHRRLDTGVLQQQRLDLARFDTDPVDLDLRIDPAEEFDRAVRQAPRQIPGPVEPALAERVAYELLSGQVGPAEVAGRYPGARDTEFALRAVGHLLKVSVEDMDLYTVDGLPDRGKSGPVGGVAVQGVGGGVLELRGAVVVVQARARAGEELPDVGADPQLLAGRDDLTQDHAPGRLRSCPSDLFQQRDRHEEPLDPLLAEEFDERVRVAPHPVVGDHERAAEAEGGEDLVEGEVETHGADLGCAHAAAVRAGAVVPVQQVE